MHYVRKYRTGRLHRNERTEVTVGSNGYVWAYAPAHPLASRSGAVYEHRAVLLNAIGLGSHTCHWCRSEVEWRAVGKRKLVVDHLDGDKLNNNINNLAASCHRCNTARGAFQKWAKEHSDDPFIAALIPAALRCEAA